MMIFSMNDNLAKFLMYPRVYLTKFLQPNFYSTQIAALKVPRIS